MYVEDIGIQKCVLVNFCIPDSKLQRSINSPYSSYIGDLIF